MTRWAVHVAAPGSLHEPFCNSEYSLLAMCGSEGDSSSGAHRSLYNALLNSIIRYGTLPHSYATAWGTPTVQPTGKNAEIPYTLARVRSVTSCMVQTYLASERNAVRQ